MNTVALVRVRILQILKKGHLHPSELLRQYMLRFPAQKIWHEKKGFVKRAFEKEVFSQAITELTLAHHLVISQKDGKDIYALTRKGLEATVRPSSKPTLKKRILTKLFKK